MFDSLWIEKYRPKKLADVVLPDHLKQKVEEYRSQQEIPHLLFVSPPGQGKTSLAKIIVTEILDCVYLYINASDENGIDTIRTKIMGFATTKSIDGKLKVVILDEADGLTQQAQQALRNCMEEYSNNVRFIITANYRYKVIPAIQSRCQDYDITPSIDGAIKKVVEILIAEKVTVDAEQKVKLINLIRNVYPDLRRIINLVSKNIVDGKLNIQQLNQGLDFAQGVLNKVLEGADVTSIRRHIIENDSLYNRDYHGLLKDLFNAVDGDEKLSTDIVKKRKFMIILAEHMYRHTMVMDPEINCYAALVALTDV
jgi:DNA polymerase III delta prime subunit